MKRVLLLGIFVWIASLLQANVTLISYGDTWKYLDNGSNPGTGWMGATFNDAAWNSGNGQLGYGDGDETTVLSAGCVPVATCSPKYITTYFRKSLLIGTTATYSNYTLNLRRDDGVIVYVDSVEVYRNNMPGGAVTSTTLASAACADDGNGIQSTTLSLATLAAGAHTLAVEIHQNANTSSDISFDLELIANEPGSVNLLRGPYLNLATQNSAHIRWRTDVSANSVIRYGTDPNNLDLLQTDAALVTEHDVTISGLAADTRYYYSIGHTSPASQTLKVGTGYYLTTLPVKGTERIIRIWAVGDCGNNSANQLNVLKSYKQYLGAAHTDAMLLLGDNAYNSGLDNEYQASFFPIYQDSLLRNVVLWPAPGNHDYANNATRQNDHAIPYYDMFTLPTAAEAGGVASGTEAFYSFDHGNIHFIALDSYGKESNTYRIWDTLGPQVTWLKSDLAANTQTWTVAYWHHPPYTLGSHTSETETDLVAIRTNVIRILERYGVDLILCGHSHVYERSYFMNGHYGNEASFNLAAYGITTSRGWYNDSSNACPYIKNAPQKLGTVYAVVGSSGQLGGSSAGWPHAAMVYSNNTLGGGMAITVNGNRLDAEWVCSDGVVRDRFTMMKNVGKKELYTTYEGDSLWLNASWKGNYSWSVGGSADSLQTAPPGLDTDTLVVADDHNCLVDSFIIAKTLRLPVALFEFGAERTPEQAVRLHWATASEWNNAYFEVEWSTDGYTFFPIGQVSGSGSSYAIQNYRFLHTAPVPGQNYYRLRQVDRDSGYTYSRIVLITLEMPQSLVISNEDRLYLYPNPSASGTFDIDYYSQKNTKTRLNVYNALGKLVYSDDFWIFPGISYYRLDISGQAPGLYLVSIDNKLVKILH